MAKNVPKRMTIKHNKRGDARYYVTSRTKSGKLRAKKFTEVYSPRGGAGLEITIGYDTKLDPDGIQTFQPLGRMMAVCADHVRDRIRKRGIGADGAPMGPAELSGAMWRSLTASITAKGKARAYFKGSSSSTRRTKTGWAVKTMSVGNRSDYKNMQPKVLNRMKALTASGLGFVPPRDPKTGRFMWWKPLIRQRFASGKHAPESILMMALKEIHATQSVLSLGMQAYALDGEPSFADWRPMGDRKLVAKMRQALKL